MTVLLDPTTKSAAAVLSGGFLTLGASNNAKNGARADTSRSSGKLWFEADCTSWGSLATDTGVGVTNAFTPNYTNLANGPSTAGALMIYRGGQVWLDGVFLGFYNNPDGQYVTFAIDQLTNKLWIYVSSTVNGWNNVITDDPCSPSGGFDISPIVGFGLYPVGTITSLANSTTFNFGVTPAHNSIPGCLTSWDTAPAAPATLNAVQHSRIAAFRQVARGLATGKPLGFDMLSTEQSDVPSFRMYPADAFTMMVTEQSDTFTLVPPDIYNIERLHAPLGFEDDEVMYVPAEPTMFVPADHHGGHQSSPFLIHTEDMMYAVPFSEPQTGD